MRPRGLGRAGRPTFPYSQIVPVGRAHSQLDDATLRAIAAAMTASTTQTLSAVPAGYTYVAQFIAHDLSFDRSGLHGGQPGGLSNRRSPTLDLDCLYGPGSRVGLKRPYSDDGEEFKIGTTTAVPTGIGFATEAHDGCDLPREPGGKAIIPDERNDENLLVAQTHAAFIRFHNRVVEQRPGRGGFAEARETVVKHYQWMIRTDFLPRIVEPAIVDAVFGTETTPPGPRAFDWPRGTLPLEFSAAAYRLGHSMVRDEYVLNKIGSRELQDLFSQTNRAGELNGPLASNWIADLRRFYDFGAAGRRDLVPPPPPEAVPEGLELPPGVNAASRIDTRLATGLVDLRDTTLPKKQKKHDFDERDNLAFRNLARAKSLGLATGQEIWVLLNEALPEDPPPLLDPDELLEGRGGADLSALTQNERDAFVESTPLWFYVLREAELKDGLLCGVGGRLVAETFHRVMAESEHSIVTAPFRPQLVPPVPPGAPSPQSGDFGMPELLLYAFKGQGGLLNPLGD